MKLAAVTKTLLRTHLLSCLALIAAWGTPADEAAWKVGVFQESCRHFDNRYPGILDIESVTIAVEDILPGLMADDPDAWDAFADLRRTTFMKHPSLTDAVILAVETPTHRPGEKGKELVTHRDLGMMETHLSLSSVGEHAPGGAIISLKVQDGQLHREILVAQRDHEPIYSIDLHWDGDRFLFSRRVEGQWRVFEYSLGVEDPIRQVSQMESLGVDAYDAAYLPNGSIVFGSDAPVQGVPCWHGLPNKVANLYSMDSQGNQVRQLCYDQGHNAQPFILRDGRVIFNRWDYTGMNRVFNQFVMQMRPDGTNQRVLYGTNTWWPNGTFGHQELPGSNKILCVVSGYHGSNRDGYLGILDPDLGDRGEVPLTAVITGTAQPAQRIVADRWIEHVYPKYTDPYPLDEDYYLAGVLQAPGPLNYRLCLVDRFGNITPLYAPEDVAVLNPVRLEQRPTPHSLPSTIDLSKDTATVFIQDVYRGPGLKGVPRGVVRKVRVIGYDYGYPTLAGVEKIGKTGPWEVVQILGEAKVHPDGSAHFNIPADTPVAFQVVDDQGQAVQLMRTWTAAMPGEKMSCIGCHETSLETPSRQQSMALRLPPQDLEPWQGHPRGFDFTREVQPLLNQKCAGCHDNQLAQPDLRPRELVPDYEGPILSHFDRIRLHENYRERFDGESRAEYSPAYEALVDYIRRVGAGDGVSLLNPGEYRANTSPLVQLLQDDHYGVELSDAEWERLFMWIDLNGPQHGSWLEVYDMPPAGGVYEARYALRERFGSKQQNLDLVFPETPDPAVHFPEPVVMEKLIALAAEATASPTSNFTQPRRKWLSVDYREVPVAADIGLTMVRVPPGTVGSLDVDEAFWMAETEIPNAMFSLFQKEHDSGTIFKRHDIRPDDKGVALNHPDQPVVRVSWEEAVAFCDWLTQRTGIRFKLPTQTQWEYACRAGSGQDFFFGDLGADYSRFANLGDRSFAYEGVLGPTPGRNLFMTASDLESLHTDLVDLADTNYRDGFIGTSPVYLMESNPLGLKNMHGNAAEWTASAASPGDEDEGRTVARIVRGGSFADPPRWATSGIRRSYPQWQRVYNVGFRVVAEHIQ